MRKLVIPLLLCAVGFAYWWTHRGHDSRRVTDLSRPFSMSVRAPWAGLQSGAMYVLVEGQLDGDATLDIRSNHGRDVRPVHLRPPAVAEIVGGAEEWVDDASVEYRPSGARTGDLYVAVYCGTGFTKQDWERYRRITTRGNATNASNQAMQRTAGRSAF